MKTIVSADGRREELLHRRRRPAAFPPLSCGGVRVFSGGDLHSNGRLIESLRLIPAVPVSYRGLAQKGCREDANL